MMDGPDLARLVLIVSRRASAEPKYKFGTGYFVTPQLVLTASHVVPDDAVEVWVRVESSGARHQAEGKVRFAWSDSRIGGALLRVSPGLLRAEPVAWMETLPENDIHWRSAGYPIAASQQVDDSTQFTTAGLEGKIFSHGGGGQGQRELELTADAPAVAEGWQGISGAPVFAGGKIAGIISQVPKGFAGARLRALPAPVLLAVAGFREALEPEWLAWPENQPWALVLKSNQQSNDLENRSRAALRTFNARHLPVTGGLPFHEEPVVAQVEDALSSPGRWLRLVRALCIAQVMMADVTEFTAGVMTALGVRAVVRRAITLTTTADRHDETKLHQLPFNIQEGRLTFHGGHFEPRDPNNPVTVISQAIRDGLLESRLNSRYLDLPAYDAVRCPIPETSAGLQAARESVLVLCSFQPAYSNNWKALSDFLLTYYAPKQPVRMLDLGSPRLVGQTLYEYIRWAGTCVVDWTSWRPNVFFELGVRLACSNLGPICVIDSREVGSPLTPQQQLLAKLFRPAEYRCDDPATTLKAEFREHELKISGKVRETPVAVVPHDGTYQLASEVFSWDDDQSIRTPHQLLRGSVEDNVGKDPQRSGVPPVLFSINPAFGERVRTSMRERLVAAWYYLKGRFPDEIRTDPSLRKEVKELGENVLLRIPSNTQDRHLKKLREEVLEYIDEYETPVDGARDDNGIG